METAPLFADVAEAPDGGAAWWITTRDDVRLRVARWNPTGPKGTVLICPGRTEYIEKYGRAAGSLAQRGYASLVIDWRGQGLSDRLLDDSMSGHVHDFPDYQRDMAAMMETATRLDLPRPWHLLAHSMGGCIGLRAVMQGLDVQSVAFSSPMWGIRLSEALRPVAWWLSWGSHQVGLSHRYAPGTTADHYVLTEPFESNKLTNDAGMWAYMERQLTAHPELGLGGPSLRWLYEALRETRALSHRPSPDLPCLTILGSEEEIVDVPRVHDRMARWSGGHLEMVAGGRHETLMDSPSTQARLFGLLGDFFDTARQKGAMALS